MTQEELMALLEERNRALLALDEAAIREYMAKAKIPDPGDEVAFWAGVHKSRCGMRDVPEDKRAESAAWLTEHGMQVPEPAAPFEMRKHKASTQVILIENGLRAFTLRGVPDGQIVNVWFKRKNDSNQVDVFLGYLFDPSDETKVVRAFEWADPGVPVACDLPLELVGMFMLPRAAKQPLRFVSLFEKVLPDDERFIKAAPEADASDGEAAQGNDLPPVAGEIDA